MEKPIRPSLNADQIIEYNKSRQVVNRDLLCMAPFNNIYFNVLGQGAACWLTFHESSTYPRQTIREIWFGEYFSNLRNHVKNHDLSYMCRVCDKNIKTRRFKNTLAQAYDLNTPVGKYPRIIEFELSNVCNLECLMCNGRLSSTIRRHRDNLPALKSPYDDHFVDQLEEFIPHLDEARFNGGEPFLQKICWDIWERIIKIKPSIQITVATNGTVLTDKVKTLLAKGNFRINLSLDGITKETYEKIRVNSNFDQVMKHVRYYSEYCKNNKSIFSVMINPMRLNWQEMPKFVQHCNENQYHLWFNTIYRPFHLSLWNLSSEKLKQIIDVLSREEFEFNPSTMNSRIFDGNIMKYRNLVNSQIRTWHEQQLQKELENSDYNFKMKSRQEARAKFYHKLRSSTGDLEYPLAVSKLTSLEEKLKKNVSADDFYHFLNELPLDSVTHDLNHKSPDLIAEQIYYMAEYY
ncbi:MAG: radical SAM protein [Oligoflexia bacterium]|nr:radical SAM protein [Oligoflexia bacterium]